MQENSEKNSIKIQKIVKPLPGIIFRQYGDKIVRESENQILLQNSVHTRPGKENSEKNSKKIQKIIKPLPALFLARTGGDRLKKRT